MNVNLNDTFEAYIKEQIASGTYNNASEVVREALRLIMQQDEIHRAKVQAFQAAITDGLNSGQTSPLDMDSIIAEAKSSVHA